LRSAALAEERGKRSKVLAAFKTAREREDQLLLQVAALQKELQAASESANMGHLVAALEEQLATQQQAQQPGSARRGRQRGAAAAAAAAARG
jgi:hypothetical protein